MGLLWQITDRNGSVVETLRDRRLGRVNIARNGPRSASVVLSLDDPKVLAIAPLRTLLQVKLDGALIFKGRITSPVYADEAGAGEAGASVEVVAFDPSNQLQRTFVTQQGGPLTFTATDQSDILAGLIEHTDAEIDAVPTVAGVVVGSLWTGGADRDRSYYYGDEIWAAIVAMSQIDGGVDFELEPAEATDGTIARLNTYERQGADKSNTLKFDYGAGRHNVAGFSSQPGGEVVRNRFTALGVPFGDDTGTFARAFIAQSPGSQALHGGVFSEVEQLESVTEAATLEAYAREQVRRYAYPVEFFDLTLPPQGASALLDKDGNPLVDFTGVAYGAPPSVGPSACWLGDTIRVRVERNVSLVSSGRVEEIQLTEDEQGSVTAKLTCTPEETVATDVEGATATVTLGAAPEAP